MSIVQHLNRYRYITSAAKDIPWPAVRAVNIATMRTSPPDLEMVKKFTAELADCKLDSLPAASPIEVVQFVALLQAMLQFQLHSQQVLKDQLVQKQNAESVSRIASQQIAALEARVQALQKQLDTAHEEKAAVQGTVFSLEKALIEATTKASCLLRELESERKRANDLLHVAAIASNSKSAGAGRRHHQNHHLCDKHRNGGAEGATTAAGDNDGPEGGDDFSDATSATSYGEEQPKRRHHAAGGGGSTKRSGSAARSSQQAPQQQQQQQQQQPPAFVDWASLAMLMAARGPTMASPQPYEQPPQQSPPPPPLASQPQAQAPSAEPQLLSIAAVETTLQNFTTSLRKEWSEHKAEVDARSEQGFQRVEAVVSQRLSHLNAKQSEILDRVGGVETTVASLQSQVKEMRSAHAEDIAGLKGSMTELRKQSLPPLAIASLAKPQSGTPIAASADPDFGKEVHSTSPSPLVSGSRVHTPHTAAPATNKPAAATAAAAPVPVNKPVTQPLMANFDAHPSASDNDEDDKDAVKVGSREGSESSNRGGGGGGGDANEEAIQRKTPYSALASPITQQAPTAGSGVVGNVSSTLKRAAVNTTEISKLDQSSILNDSQTGGGGGAIKTLPRRESELAKAKRELEALLAEEAADEEKRRSLDASAASATD